MGGGGGEYRDRETEIHRGKAGRTVTEKGWGEEGGGDGPREGERERQ